MATFKAVVRTPRRDGFYQVYIRVVQNTKPGYIKTDKMITKDFIDRHGNITDPFVNEYCAQRILHFTQLLNTKDTRNWTVKQIIELSPRRTRSCVSRTTPISTSTAWLTEGR